MSQDVNKLKEILFDSETRALTDLKKRLEMVFARSGTQERFRTSVADVLDGALRDAEVERHAALSDAIAPLIVRTIKTEITNSQDELAEALYPMTGRMVKAYVASAIKDLTNQINRSLERNPVMLRINSLLSGRSVAELALADAQALKLEELYLIKRGSGELVARWPEDIASANRDQVMSGILTAINEFAIEAFRSDGAALRQIDLGDAQVYLRGSPTYLLAAKFSGTATTPIEQTIDEAFLNAIEKHHDLTHVPEDASKPQFMRANNDPDSATPGKDEKQDQKEHVAVLSKLAERLNTGISAYYEENAASGATTANPVKGLLWIIGLAFAVWLGLTVFEAYLTYKTRTKAEYVLNATQEMSGYPVKIDTAPYGRTVTIDGLAPSPQVKRSLIEGLRAILPSARVNDRLSVVNSNFPNHRPELMDIHQKIHGIETRVTKLDTGVTGLKGEVSGIETGLSGVKTGLSGVKTGLSGVKTEISNVGNETRNRIETLNDRLTREAVIRATTRAHTRLNASLQDLNALLENLENPQARSRVEEARAKITSILPKIEAQRTATSQPGNNVIKPAVLKPAMNVLATSIDHAAQQIAPALTAEQLKTNGRDTTGKDNATPSSTRNLSLSEAAENLAIRAEHFATLATAATQASLMKAPPPQTPSAREKLESWTRANAIFFSTDQKLTNQRLAHQKLRHLTQLIKDAGTLVRVIGFTDEKKSAAVSNSILSRARAEKIRRILISQGVPSKLLVAVGRKNTKEISPSAGEGTPNRRVEFELGFIGEQAR